MITVPADRDQLSAISGTVITIDPGTFSTGGEVALDITEGKLFSEGQLRERQRANRRLSMRKIKEVLRLRFELGWGSGRSPRLCALSQGAVHNYLRKAAAAEIHWPLPEGWDEERNRRSAVRKHAPANDLVNVSS